MSPLSLHLSTLLPLVAAALLISVTTLPLASAATRPRTCNTNDDCSDGRFCNGVEICTSGTCTNGTSPVCDDGISCTQDRCDEKRNKCVFTPKDVRCDDFVFCNGREVCDTVLGCQPGNAPPCRETLKCTTKGRCDEQSNSCTSTPVIGCACNKDRECGPRGCCCGGDLGCQKRTSGVPCSVTCANQACERRANGNETCVCITSCDGPFCSAVGGGGAEPCGTHGKCCCARGSDSSQSPAGNAFRENCVDCGANCGKNTERSCTGDFVPGRLTSLCTQKIDSDGGDGADD
eukprot:jgi/Mesvir1/22820/Mv20082-RA.1